MTVPASPGSIGVSQLVTFYVTSLIGAGILLIPTVTAQLAGPASLLSWVALAVAAYPFALMFALMSSHWPDSAGLAALMRHGHGQAAGDSAALALVVSPWLRSANPCTQIGAVNSGVVDTR